MVIRTIFSFIFGTLCFHTTAQNFQFDTVKVLNQLKEYSSDAFEGRGLMQPGGIKSQQFVAANFKALGLKQFDSTYIHPFEFISETDSSTITGANIIGYLEGTTLKDQFIVVSSHHDHLGIIDGVIYNGADDNGSGTCGLFALAEMFKKNPPKHSVIFVAFDAEESDLMGSKEFVNHPPVPLDKIVFNVNIDMIGRNIHNELYVTGAHHHRWLKPLVKPLRNNTSLTISFGHDKKFSRKQDWTYSSDHTPFHLKKIPFIYFGEEDHPDYHHHTDDFEFIDPQFYVRSIDFVGQVFYKIDTTL